MQVHIARRLSEAIGSWLHFEFCCYRAGLFSEDSLKAAVGGGLSSFPISTKGSRVHANFPHEALNPIKKAGRKKEVDFALVLSGNNLPKKNVQIAVETKWAGSSHCSPENIFKDFLRLAAIKHVDSDSTCVFILAGKDKDVRAILDGMPFCTDGRVNKGIKWLGKRESRITLDSANICHRRCFSEGIRDLSSVGIFIPDSFVTQAYGLHPEQTKASTIDFQSIAWELTEISDQPISADNWA